MKTILIVISLFLSRTVLATSASDVQSKAGETVDTAAEFTKEKRDRFVKEMDENLAILSAKIKDIKSKTGNSKNQSVNKLEGDRKSLEHNIAKMKKTSGKAFMKVRDGLVKAWDDIKSSLSDASESVEKK